MPRIILHVDMDAFYVAAERLRDADLEGQPVIIGADPKEGKGRGVVAACSYEARERGVHSAQPISVAYRKAPDAVFLRPDFSYYGQVSNRVMAVLQEFADAFEQVSIDEAFLDVSSRVEDHDGGEALARRIKEAVQREVGLTCSIGMAPNKSIAKIASDMEKPDGLTVVRPEEVEAFLAPLPVAKIPGVGPKTRKVLEEMGAETIGALAQRTPGELTDAFGKGGVWLWAIATGREEAPVEEEREPKSFSAEHTFERNLDDWERILDAVPPLVDDVHWRVRDDDFLYRTVSIKVRFENFDTYTRDRTLSAYANDRETIERVARELLREFQADERKVRLLGVRVAGLKRTEPGQETLSRWTE